MRTLLAGSGSPLAELSARVGIEAVRVAYSSQDASAVPSSVTNWLKSLATDSSKVESLRADQAVHAYQLLASKEENAAAAKLVRLWIDAKGSSVLTCMPPATARFLFGKCLANGEAGIASLKNVLSYSPPTGTIDSELKAQSVYAAAVEALGERLEEGKRPMVASLLAGFMSAALQSDQEISSEYAEGMCGALKAIGKSDLAAELSSAWAFKGGWGELSPSAMRLCGACIAESPSDLPEARESLRASVMEAAGKYEGKFEEMAWQDLYCFMQALRLTGFRGEANSLASDWAAANDLGALKASQLSAVLWCLELEGPIEESLATKLETEVRARMNAGNCAATDIFCLTNILLQAKKPERAAQWVQDACDYVASAGQDDQVKVEDLFWTARAVLATTHRDNPATKAKLLAKLRVLLEQGQDIGTAYAGEVFAMLVDEPDSLSGSLVDAEGCVRLGAAKVLSWAYRFAGQVPVWQAILDDHISGAPPNSDELAGWCLARGYAQSIAPPVRSLLSGKKWFDQALATAESPSIRLDALRAIAEGYARTGKHDKGLSVLDSVADQFENTDVFSEVAALKDEILRARDAFRTERLRQKARQAREAKLAWQRELRKRLSVASERGDQAEVDRLGRILEE